MKFLNWLDGKKTAIGAIASTTIAFIHIKGLVDSDTATYLLSMSSILVGVGIAHKVQKSANND